MKAKATTSTEAKTGFFEPGRIILVVMFLMLVATIITHQDFGGYVLGHPDTDAETTGVSSSTPDRTDGQTEKLDDSILSKRIWTLDSAGQLAREFKQIAFPTETDKVSTHHYEYAYAKYLSTWKAQKKKVKLLEIGLGCGMPYGPGASYHLWYKYFEGRADIYFLEYSCSCAQKWQEATPRPGLKKIYCGDQADPELLKTIVSDAQDSGQLYDFIIDDGGHTMKQQKVSLEYLLAGVKPGGVYFLEDLLTSYMPKYQDDDPTMLETIKTFVDSVNEKVGGQVQHSYSRIIKSFECMLEICVFTTNS